MCLWDIVEKLKSPHADKIYVAKDYTKADLLRDLEDAALNYEGGDRSPQTLEQATRNIEAEFGGW